MAPPGASSATPPNEANTPPPGSDATSGPGAFITIGPRNWTFELFGIFGSPCTRREPDDNSLLIATGYVGGDTDGASFTAHLEPGGRDVEGLASVHFVTVHDPATGETWMADELEFPLEQALAAIPDGFSQIDSLRIDDGFASGTATFIETGAVQQAWEVGGMLPAPERGTFRIHCGP